MAGFAISTACILKSQNRTVGVKQRRHEQLIAQLLANVAAVDPEVRPRRFRTFHERTGARDLTEYIRVSCECNVVARETILRNHIIEKTMTSLGE